ncbi:MAG: hypothetical protein ACPG7F_18965, partial [Aggregatilineales bacterium]
MEWNSFYIAISDPLSDTLTAQGLTYLLGDLLDKQRNPTDSIRIIDCGGYLRLDLKYPIHEETIESLSLERFVMGGIRFIETPKNKAKLPAEMSSVYIENYEDIKAQNSRFYDTIREGKRGDDLLAKPLIWDVLRAINPAALPGWNSVLSDWWKLREVQPLIVRMILEMYSTLPNPVDEMMAQWKALNKEHGWGVSETATCQQFFNPTQGKGQNRTKADAVSIGNMKGFWLVELLKMVGFYHDAITKTVAGGKDRKVFVIAPRDIPISDHREILATFKPTITSEASASFDILAALRYSQTLLNHLQEREDLLRSMMGLPVNQKLVAGFHTAFYLSLGNAVATMNMSFMALPGWIVINDADDITDYNYILSELIDFTRQFEEKNSDAFTLLQYLRDFVSGDDLEAFFKLTTAFSSYLIGMRERSKYARQLSTDTIERIIRMTDAKLSPILDSAGFQNIAAAIRASTVSAQYRKASGDRLYDIRYGLGRDLNRVADKTKPARFIAALSEFMSQYNAENARIFET